MCTWSRRGSAQTQLVVEKRAPTASPGAASPFKSTRTRKSRCVVSKFAANVNTLFATAKPQEHISLRVHNSVVLHRPTCRAPVGRLRKAPPGVTERGASSHVLDSCGHFLGVGTDCCGGVRGGCLCAARVREEGWGGHAPPPCATAAAETRRSSAAAASGRARRRGTAAAWRSPERALATSPCGSARRPEAAWQRTRREWTPGPGGDCGRLMVPRGSGRSRQRVGATK